MDKQEMERVTDAIAKDTVEIFIREGSDKNPYGCPNNCHCPKDLSVCPICEVHIVNGSEDMHINACKKLHVLLQEK